MVQVWSVWVVGNNHNNNLVASNRGVRCPDCKLQSKLPLPLGTVWPMLKSILCSPRKNACFPALRSVCSWCLGWEISSGKIRKRKKWGEKILWEPNLWAFMTGSAPEIFPDSSKNLRVRKILLENLSGHF